MRKVKILIADDEEILRDVLEMILDAEINAEYIKVSNGKEGETVLKTAGDIDLIISDYNMPIANGGYLFEINKSTLNVPFVLISGGNLENYHQFKNFKEANSLNLFIEKPYDQDQLVNSIKSIIEKIDNKSIEIIEPKTELIKLKLMHFMRYAKDASDVFISLSPDKFVKISDENPNTQPGNEILNHYLNKKIEYVYIDRAQFTALIKSYRENIVNFHNPDEKIELAGHVFHLSLNCLNAMGINQFQIELTNGIVEETINELKKEKSIIEKFKKIYDSEGYIVAHSMLLVHMASAILKKSNLNHFASMKKISMAAFLHDMSLIEDELALFESDIDAIKSNQSREKLLSHPISSGNLLTSNSELFDETRKIIVEHHEKPDGSGYPKGTHGKNLFILSALFILAHDITLHLIKNNYKSDHLRHFLSSNKEYYSIGHFEKFYQIALETLT